LIVLKFDNHWIKIKKFEDFSVSLLWNIKQRHIERLIKEICNFKQIHYSELYSRYVKENYKKEQLRCSDHLICELKLRVKTKDT
jgi:hypothetical protein